MILKAIIKKRKIVYIIGDNKSEVANFICFLLKNNLSVYYLKRMPRSIDIISIFKSNVIIIEDDSKDDVMVVKEFLKPFFCTFVVIEALKKGRIKKFLNNFGKNWDMVLDYSIAKKLKKKRGEQLFTFAINKKNADFNVTDIKREEDRVNFKLNHKGTIIPFWVGEKISKKDIYSMLSAICVAQTMNLNLAEISYEMKKKWPLNKG